MELYELVRDEIDINMDAVKFYTDSKIVLGYIHNSTRRFYTYVVALLIRVARSFKTNSDQRNFQGWKCNTEATTVSEIFRAEVVIILTVQSEIFREEFKCLETKQTLPKQSPLKKLNPIIDEHGLLGVGGRLAPVNMTKEEKHPLIIPHTHYVATLLVR